MSTKEDAIALTPTPTATATVVVILTALVLLPACAPGTLPIANAPAIVPTLPPSTTKTTPPPLPNECPTTLDFPAFLIRHAAIFGTPDTVARDLPISLTGTSVSGGKHGTAELMIDSTAYRATSRVAGVIGAEGVDREGAWVLPLTSGIVWRERDKPGEAAGPRSWDWLLRRRYLVDYSPARDSATCAIVDGEARIQVTYRLADLGNPELSFSVPDATLVGFKWSDPLHRQSLTTFGEWRPGASGTARWPSEWIEMRSGGVPAGTKIERVQAGLHCTPSTRSPPLVDAPVNCVAPPPDTVRRTWPANGRARVPFELIHNAILLEARVDGRPVRALLDSGAGMSVVDATMPLGEGFTPAIFVDGAGSTAKVRLGVGALGRVEFGGLTVENLPAANVPMAGLASFGARRPELILGLSFVQAAAVRIDFANQEIVLAQSGAGLQAADAVAIDLAVLGGELIVPVKIEDTDAFMKLDTGNDGGFDLFAPWARAHDLPGTRATVTTRGLFGAGTQLTSNQRFRLARASFGPITLTNTLTTVLDPPIVGSLAGLLGNAVLAGCRAVTVDARARLVYLDPPCRPRSVGEPRAGLLMSAGEIVGEVVKGGSAERAGVRAGDHVLQINGHPAAVGDERFIELESAPAGSRIPILVERKGRPLRLTLHVTPPPAP